MSNSKETVINKIDSMLLQMNREAKSRGGSVDAIAIIGIWRMSTTKMAKTLVDLGIIKKEGRGKYSIANKSRWPTCEVVYERYKEESKKCRQKKQTIQASIPFEEHKVNGETKDLLLMRIEYKLDLLLKKLGVL